MYLLGKNIETLSEEDIKRLIINQISESKILDYKKELKIDSGDDKKEFLYDLTSLANTEGGTIIFGIEEQKDLSGQNTGVPSRITGVPIDNKDKLIQRIEDIVRNNVEPNLVSLRFNLIPVEEQNVLIIGIPKTIGLPHMVTYNSTNKFYKRRNSGKYLLDVYELNSAFMNSLSIKEAAINFREQRVKEIRDLKFLPKLDIAGSYILHVIPLGHLGENVMDISNQRILDYLSREMRPIKSRGCDYRHNLDGYMAFATSTDNKAPYSYVQIFRDGTIEFYTSHLHYPRQNDAKKLDFAGQEFETVTLKSIKTAFDIFSFYHIEPPYAIFISLFDLDDAVIYTQNQFRDTTGIIGKSQLLFPAVVFNDSSQDIAKTMKSTFDILWQAGNYSRSPFYNDNNERTTI